jgi:putative ABC transport system permease protein
MTWQWRKEREKDLERELRSDLELETSEQQENGLSAEEARYAAQRALGSTALIKEEIRETWGWSRIESFMQDLRFALRAFRRSPAFMLLAIGVLALGTGANTAIFSVFDAVLLRPLPFQDPGRVMLVYETIPKRGIDRSNLCAANFSDLRQRSQTFTAMAALSGSGFALTGDTAPEQLSGALVTTSFFSVFGVSPELGRAFRSQDEDPGGAGVVILSHRLWDRRFGRDREILGKNILLNGRPHQVIGVMPQGFQALFRDHELWVPMQMTPEERANRTSHFLLGVGRLGPGVTPQQAESELDTIGRALERDYPIANAGRGLRAAPVHEELVGDTKSALVLLMGAVSLLLVVACVNVANLLLARALSRRKEIAIRRALGASPQRLLQQLLTEGFLLALLGVGTGLLLAVLALRVLPLTIPAALSLPGLDHVAIDGPVLTVAILTGVFVTAIFGCLPTWQVFASVPDSFGEKGAAWGRGTGRYHLRSTLLAVEVALSLVLLLGAGLLLRSFRNLMEVQPGFHADRLLTVQLQIPARFQSPQEQAAFVRQVQDHVRAVPGVEDVSAIEYLPLSGSGITRRMIVEARPRPEAGGEPIVQRHLVTPDYFRTMGIPMRSGHDFREGDMNGQHFVVVINESMARRYWPNQSPVGQRVRLGTQGTVANAPPREIIGVVGDVRHTGLRTDPRDEVYVPLGQDGWPVIHLVARSHLPDLTNLTPEIRTALWSVDKNQPLPDVKPMARIVADSVWEPRLNTVALSAFAGVTLMLALAGIYGLMIRIVGDRTAEIGIRIAMGARPSAVLILVLRQGFVPVLMGVAAGLGLSLAGSRFVSNQLYGVTQADPLTFAASVVLIVTAAFLAMMRPALRAARMDPIATLRHD